MDAEGGRSTAKYPDKKESVGLGCFVVGDTGYVMNQRFAFIIGSTERTSVITGIKVELEPTWKTR